MHRFRLVTFVAAVALSIAQVAVGQPVDSDGDLLVDAWEYQFGLDPFDATGDNGTNGDPDLDGVRNLEEFLNRTHPRGAHVSYLVEGAAGLGIGFRTEITLFNPSALVSARVLLTIYTPDRPPTTSFWRLEPLERRRFGPTELTDTADSEFSIVIESDVPFAAERTTGWPAAGAGRHASSATPKRPYQTGFAFAEGTTRAGAQEFLIFLNDEPRDTDVCLGYYRPAPLPPIYRRHRLPAHRRVTVWVNYDAPGLEATDLGVTAGTGPFCPGYEPGLDSFGHIQAERALYLVSPDGHWTAGHASAGTDSQRLRYFAEGAAGRFFDTYLTLLNALPQQGEVTVTFGTAEGAPLVRTYTVPALSRATINLELDAPALADTAFGFQVETGGFSGIVAERAMWWGSPSWYESHASAGALQPASTWAIADGEEGGPESANTYLLVYNPSPGPAEVVVTLVLDDRSTRSRTYSLPGTTRLTVPVGIDFPETAGGMRFSAIVRSVTGYRVYDPVPVVVERSTYWTTARPWDGGVNVMGTALP